MKQVNYQSELHFDFTVHKLQTHKFFVQEVQLPGVFTEAPQTGTQFSPIKHIGDTLFFQDLIVTLKLDEGFDTWFELFKWLTGLTRSESYDQFNELIKDQSKTLDGAKKLFRGKESLPGGKGYKNTKSTASLLAKDANFQTYLEMVFINLHPTSISGFTFRTNNDSHNYIVYDVSFAYDIYFPRKI